MTTLISPVAGFVRTVLQKLLSILETPLVYLFGRDIFISYARSDAANYAQQLAIGIRTDVPQLSFFLDQWASATGRTMPLSLILALRWSRLLVFVGTENAIASQHVRKELQTFFNRKGRFVPIDVGGALNKAMREDEFLSAICGPGAVVEERENVTNSQPSKGVVTRVVNAVQFTRQDQRLRRAVIGTTLGVLAIIGTAIVVSRSIIADANAQARDARAEARQATVAAETAKGERQAALADLNRAKIDTQLANEEKANAQKLAKEAKDQAEIAKTMRVEAEQLRDQARADAARQSEIATLRQRANQSELTLRQSPTRLADSVSYAVESMTRADKLGIHSLEADGALRASLSLLPRSFGSREVINGNVADVALSPDGAYVAVLRESVSGSTDQNLQIQQADGKVIAAFRSEDERIALSNGAERISLSDGNMVRTREIAGSRSWELEFTDPITNMALSHDGRYLALALRHADIEEYENRGTEQENPTFAEVWDVESGKLVARLRVGFLKVQSIAFSANSHYLAVGGSGEGPGGAPMGRALVWDLRGRRQAGRLTAEDFHTPDELLQRDTVYNVVPGPDDGYVATASAQLATVWRRFLRTGYREVARMPIEQIVQRVAFNSAGNRLTVLSSRRCSVSEANCRPSYNLELWEPVGHWDAARLPHQSSIEAFSFQPGDEFITTLTSYGEDRLRLWKASDGQEARSMKWHVEPTMDVETFTSDVRYVVTKHEDVWSVWDVLDRNKIPVMIEVEFERVVDTALSPDGNLLAVTGKAKGDESEWLVIYKREGSTYRMTRKFTLADYGTKVAISADHKYVAVSSYKKGVQVFDLTKVSNAPAGSIELSEVSSFQFAPDSQHVAILLGDRRPQTVGVWRLSDFQKIAEVNSSAQIPTYTFNSTGQYLAVSTGKEGVELLDLKTRRTRHLPSDSTVKAIAFSADGRLLGMGNDAGLVTVVDLSTGDEIAQLQHENDVTRVAFSSDGKYVAVSTRAGTERPRPEEEYLLHLWLLRPRDLLQEACARLTRFRPDELSFCAAR